MIEWLVHMWQGYLRVVLTGIAPERFFNMCRVQEIELWNIKKEQDAYVCCMTVKGLKRSKPLLKKAKVRLRIKEKFGLPFFLYRNRKRKLTVLGMLLFVVILYGMTWFIWDISFLGNTHYTDEMLLTYLNQQEIRYGMIKYQISCEELEEKIRLDFSDITWVSARVSGTRLIIQVKENEVLTQNEEVSNDSPCNLTAQKDGVIVSMVVRSGIPKVKVGDVVEKGQILVEGRVPILNDAKEEVRSQFLRADAEIFAECELFYEDCFPMLHEERSLTGKERKGWYLQVLDESFVWLLPKKKDTSWNVVTQVYPVSIWENFVLPISWGRIDAKEYVTYETLYSKEEADGIARENFSEFLLKFTQKGVQILENDVKVVSDESECKTWGMVTMIEQIASPSEILQEHVENLENMEAEEMVTE